MEEGILRNAVIEGSLARSSVTFDGVEYEIDWDDAEKRLTASEAGRKVLDTTNPKISGGLFSFEKLAYAEEIKDGVTLTQTFQDGTTDLEVTKNNLSVFKLLSLDPSKPVSFTKDGQIWNARILMPYEDWEVEEGVIRNRHVQEQVWSDTFQNEVLSEKETTVWIKAEELLAAGIGTGSKTTQNLLFSKEGLTFIQGAKALGAEYLDYGNGLVSLSIRHSLGQQALDFAADYLKTTYETGIHVFKKAVEFGTLAVDTTKEISQFLLDQSLDFLGGGSHTPAEIERYGNIAQLDMQFEWLCGGERDCRDPGAILDLSSLSLALPLAGFGRIPPNLRWRYTVEEAAPKAANLIKDKTLDFLYIPGVNTEGYDQTGLDNLYDSVAVPGKRIIFAHSAGTDTLLRAVETLSAEDLKDVVLVFASPRVSYDAFEKALATKGLSKNQIIVMGSAEDYLYTPTASLSEVFQQPIEIGYDTSTGGNTAYRENAGNWYSLVWLEEDQTAKDNPNTEKKILGHNSTVEGIRAGHLYVVTQNQEKLPDPILISDLLKKLTQQIDQDNGNTNGQ